MKESNQLLGMCYQREKKDTFMVILCVGSSYVYDRHNFLLLSSILTRSNKMNDVAYGTGNKNCVLSICDFQIQISRLLILFILIFGEFGEYGSVYKINRSTIGNYVGSLQNKHSMDE